jgi:hypothetical protein
MGDDHEVLLLSYERLLHGVLFLREVVYGSDHRVYARVSWLTDPEEGFRSHGWRQVAGPAGEPACWREREALEELARKMAAKGWEATWHPKAAPGLREMMRQQTW